MHVGRKFEGHEIEDWCPCPKAPCGLVDLDNTNPDCTQHPMGRSKTMRQGHAPDACPGMIEQRELLAREVFVADNARQSRLQSLADWDMLTNSKSPGDQLHTRYAYAIAEGLLARGARIDPAVATA